LNEKLLASEWFKDKKDSYKASVSVPFKTDRLTENALFKNMPKQDFIKNKNFLKDKNQDVLVSCC
jgi:hypothetical protein